MSPSVATSYTQPHRTAAVILAGGKGLRLGGVVKANVTIGGVRLIERVAAVLGGSGPLLVAVGRHGPDAMALPAGAVPVLDLEGPLRGPLAGLAAAARWCADQAEPPDSVVTAAVDTPFLPADFIDRLIAALGAAGDAAIATYCGQPYPTNAAWRLAALRPLLDSATRAALAPGGVRGFARGLRTRLVDWPQTAAGDPFANLNTAADRDDLERRALAEATARRA